MATSKSTAMNLSSHVPASSSTANATGEVAWSALVRGKTNTDLRMIATFDVVSVTNLIIYTDTLEGANIEVKPDERARGTRCVR